MSQRAFDKRTVSLLEAIRLVFKYCCCCSILGVMEGALGIGPLWREAGPEPAPATPGAAAGFTAAAARMFQSSRFRYLASSLSGSLLESEPGARNDPPPAAGPVALESEAPPIDAPPVRFYNEENTYFIRDYSLYMYLILYDVVIFRADYQYMGHQTPLQDSHLVGLGLNFALRDGDSELELLLFLLPKAFQLGRVGCGRARAGMRGSRRLVPPWRCSAKLGSCGKLPVARSSWIVRATAEKISKMPILKKY